MRIIETTTKDMYRKLNRMAALMLLLGTLLLAGCSQVTDWKLKSEVKKINQNLPRQVYDDLTLTRVDYRSHKISYHLTVEEKGRSVDMNQVADYLKNQFIQNIGSASNNEKDVIDEALDNHIDIAFTIKGSESGRRIETVIHPDELEQALW
ncbi:hypothetical protein C7120_02755 [Prevotella sp. oral taxon 376]|uniref:hypothetical protein n=1 Tax=Prevotella sp. oral taxon 376 TaxID=712466 RepID=UPI000D1DFA0F|nr:hypothetical protein [Prevotella sp. oral taxon 376]PTL33550.1 hypothetical protein C7120_02755 [Prevotella sp. oral taxon 376]